MTVRELVFVAGTANRFVVGYCPDCGNVIVIENDGSAWPLAKCGCGWKGPTTTLAERVRFDPREREAARWVRIGDLARRIHRHPDVVRRYEIDGLIPPAHRDHMNTRVWTEEEALKIVAQFKPRVRPQNGDSP